MKTATLEKAASSAFLKAMGAFGAKAREKPAQKPIEKPATGLGALFGGGVKPSTEKKSPKPGDELPKGTVNAFAKALGVWGASTKS